MALEGGEGLVEGALIGADALGGADLLGRGDGRFLGAGGGAGGGGVGAGGGLLAALGAGGGSLDKLLVVGLGGLVATGGQRFVDRALIEAEPGRLALALFGDVAEKLGEAEGAGGLAGFEQAHAAVGADQAGVGGLLAGGELEDVGDAEFALAGRRGPVGAGPAPEAQLEVRAKLVLEEALLVVEVAGEPGEFVGRFVLKERALLDEHAAHAPGELLLALSCIGRHVGGCSRRVLVVAVGVVRSR